MISLITMEELKIEDLFENPLFDFDIPSEFTIQVKYKINLENAIPILEYINENSAKIPFNPSNKNIYRSIIKNDLEFFFTFKNWIEFDIKDNIMSIVFDHAKNFYLKQDSIKRIIDRSKEAIYEKCKYYDYKITTKPKIWENNGYALFLQEREELLNKSNFQMDNNIDYSIKFNKYLEHSRKLLERIKI